jgi:hypothetical protein
VILSEVAIEEDSEASSNDDAEILASDDVDSTTDVLETLERC